MKALTYTPSQIRLFAVPDRDERLARSATKGDADAVDQIFDRHHDELHAYSHVLLGNADDADAALASARLTAALALGEDRRRIAVRPWLYRLAHNESIAVLRRRQIAAAPGPFEILAAREGRADAAAEDLSDDLKQLSRDMLGLGERERGALLMREMAGFGYDEIADAFACTVANARRSVFRARDALHELQDGRTAECRSAVHALSERDDKVISGLRVRVHLLRCHRCRGFRQAIRARSTSLGRLVRSGQDQPGFAAAKPKAGVGRG